MKKHNFNAGPSILPREVIEDTAKAILDFNGSGLSLMEISHRAKDFQPVVDEAEALFKELLNIPEGYSVLFLGGGASMEFCMVPFNFLEKKAAYLNTGVWAKKAMKEAKGFGEVVEVASSAEATYTYIPKDYTIPADADYFHITTNNTIYGTELKERSRTLRFRWLPICLLIFSLVQSTFPNISVSMVVRRKIWLLPVLHSLS